MKTRTITLLGLFAGMFATASAEDLVIKMTEESGVEIVNDARFDIVNKCLGNTMPGTTICLGEIDFGDGTTYAANGAEFAHENPDTEGTLDFYMGDPDNGGLLFTQIDVKGTNAFQYYRTFRYNFYPEGTDGFTWPTGKHQVYMRYNNCEGNLKKIVFYNNEFTEEEQGEMPDPTYDYFSIPASAGSVVNPEVCPDAKLNDGVWGNTGEGLIVKFPSIDFKDGNTYQQIAVVSTHGGSTNPNGFLEIYIDGTDSEDNMIARIWTARDWYWTVYGTLAKNLEKNISGVHDLYVKWTGATNLKEIQLIEGTPWEIEDDEPEKIELIDEPLTDNAYGMHFDSMGGIENTVEFMAYGSDDLKFEASNIGYTSYGVVLKFVDVDFQNGQFTRILVDHSSDQASLGSSTFDFYIDLDHDDYSDLSVLENDTKLATVQAQGTSNWATPKKTAGTMTSKVEGVHDLYMVFRTDAGANIHGVYLDTDYDPSSISTATIEGVKVWGMTNAVCIESATESLTVDVYNFAGQNISQTKVAAGLSTLSMAKGIYLVKVADAKGNVATYKLSVK